MSKNVTLKYRVVTGKKPGTSEIIYRPVITDRPTMYIDQFVEYALNSGYVRGQFQDLKGLLNGFIQAMQQAGLSGYAVNLSNWLRIHAELTGSVGEDRTLSSANSLNVNITALTDLKASIDDFNWSNVDDTGARVKISGILDPGGTAGVVVRGSKIFVAGKNLKFDAAYGDTMTVDYEGASAPVSITPTESDDYHQLYNWPTVLAELEEGTILTFKLTSRGGVEGAASQVNTAKAVVALPSA